MAAKRLETKQSNLSPSNKLPWVMLCDRLVAEPNHSISQIVLFGSQARKSAQKDSDVDLLIVVKERTPSIVNWLRSIRYEVMAQYGFEPLLTLLIVSEEEWKNLPNQSAGLVANIEKEGVLLWSQIPARTFLN